MADPAPIEDNGNQASFIVHPDPVAEMTKKFEEILQTPPDWDPTGYWLGDLNYFYPEENRLVILPGKLSEDICGPNGVTQEAILRELGHKGWMSIFDAPEHTIVYMTAVDQENLIKAELELWKVIAEKVPDMVQREVKEISKWKDMSDKNKALFQEKYSVSVTEKDASLELVSFTDEMLMAAEDYLRNKTDDLTPKHLKDILRGDPLKAIMVINSRNSYPYIQRLVHEFRDQRNVYIYRCLIDTKTVLFITAQDKPALMEAQFEIWRRLRCIMYFKRTRYIRKPSVVNFWRDNLSLEQKVKFMALTKTVVEDRPNYVRLFLQAFAENPVEDAERKLNSLSEL